MSSDDQRSILQAIARRAMVDRGFDPDFPPGARAQLARLADPPVDGARDLRALPWSSIDNDESRDLDQIEVCIDEPGAPTRLLIGIADVDALVPKGSPIDDHARTNTTSVYTPAEIFPMLPELLSTDRTSLNDGAERTAIVIELRIERGTTIVGEDVYAARVRNQAKLAYPSVAAWLDGAGPAPPAIAEVPGLEQQIRMQDQLAVALRSERDAQGALEFDRIEMKPVLEGDRVADLQADVSNRARDIIENFMIAANGVTARFLAGRGFPLIRRVVRAPERWTRIAALATAHGGHLPPEPDAGALASFLKEQRASAPDTFPDLSLAVIKLLGRGEYVASGPGVTSGHFALAVSSYTHSTAPNRRFPDLLTQRQIKAALRRERPAYDLETLDRLAQHCTEREDAANKVERLVKKSAAALWLQDRIGSTYDAIVTGASDKGTWVRIAHPPVEGRLERGTKGLDVGDRVRVRLTSTNPERGFIDFERA